MTVQTPKQPRVHCVACGHRMVVKIEPGTSWRHNGDSGVVCESCSKQEHGFELVKLVVRYCHKCGDEIPTRPVITCGKCVQEARNGQTRSK